MINFIICDDDEKFIDNIVNIIDKVMMQNDLDYDKHIFTEYNQEFLSLINQKMSFKIYILDIQVKNKTGIEMAKIIRKNDIESMIIFFTAYYNKYLKEIIKSRFMFLDFINKEDDYKKELKIALVSVIKNINKKNIIRFRSQNIIYTINVNDILYITRNKDRKCIIKTDYTEYEVNKNLKDLYNLLDSRFSYSHRACIVNEERIVLHDKKNKIITFDNGDTTSIVSSMFKLKDQI